MSFGSGWRVCNQLSEAIATSDGPKAVAKQAVEIHAKLHKSKSSSMISRSVRRKVSVSPIRWRS